MTTFKLGKLATFAFSAAMIGALPFQSDAASTESYIGTVFPTAAVYCPANTVEANGQILAISQFDALYSVIGTAYGGDGRTSFGLPDLRGRVAVGAGQGIGLTNTPRGTKNGRQNVTLTTANLPPHTHEGEMSAQFMNHFAVSNARGTKTTPDDGDWIANMSAGPRTYSSYIPTSQASTTVALKAGSASTTPFGTVTVDNTTDGGQSLEFNAPTIVLRYCVVTKGIYPPRG